MKKSRFAEEAIVAILAEADRGEQTIGDVCRAHGVSEPTLPQLAEEGGGQEYRQLKQENARLNLEHGQPSTDHRKQENGRKRRDTVNEPSLYLSLVRS